MAQFTIHDHDSQSWDLPPKIRSIIITIHQRIFRIAKQQEPDYRPYWDAEGNWYPPLSSARLKFWHEKPHYLHPSPHGVQIHLCDLNLNSHDPVPRYVIDVGRRTITDCAKRDRPPVVINNGILEDELRAIWEYAEMDTRVIAYIELGKEQKIAEDAQRICDERENNVKNYYIRLHHMYPSVSFPPTVAQILGLTPSPTPSLDEAEGVSPSPQKRRRIENAPILPHASTPIVTPPPSPPFQNTTSSSPVKRARSPISGPSRRPCERSQSPSASAQQKESSEPNAASPSKRKRGDSAEPSSPSPPKRARATSPTPPISTPEQADSLAPAPTSSTKRKRDQSREAPLSTPSKPSRRSTDRSPEPSTARAPEQEDTSHRVSPSPSKRKGDEQLAAREVRPIERGPLGLRKWKQIPSSLPSSQTSSSSAAPETRAIDLLVGTKRPRSPKVSSGSSSELVIVDASPFDGPIARCLFCSADLEGCLDCPIISCPTVGCPGQGGDLLIPCANHLDIRSCGACRAAAADEPLKCSLAQCPDCDVWRCRAETRWCHGPTKTKWCNKFGQYGRHTSTHRIHRPRPAPCPGCLVLKDTGWKTCYNAEHKRKDSCWSAENKKKGVDNLISKAPNMICPSCAHDGRACWRHPTRFHCVHCMTDACPGCKNEFCAGELDPCSICYNTKPCQDCIEARQKAARDVHKNVCPICRDKTCLPTSRKTCKEMRRTIVCPLCDKTTCSDHWKKCTNCGTPACHDCRRMTREECKIYAWEGEQGFMQCIACGHYVCQSCMSDCRHCKDGDSLTTEDMLEIDDKDCEIVELETDGEFEEDFEYEDDDDKEKEKLEKLDKLEKLAREDKKAEAEAMAEVEQLGDLDFDAEYIALAKVTRALAAEKARRTEKEIMKGAAEAAADDVAELGWDDWKNAVIAECDLEEDEDEEKMMSLSRSREPDDWPREVDYEFDDEEKEERRRKEKAKEEEEALLKRDKGKAKAVD